MTAAINPADKSLIIVIELSLWMQHDVWLLAGEFMPKAQSRRAHPLSSLAQAEACPSLKGGSRLESGYFPITRMFGSLVSLLRGGRYRVCFMARPLLYRRATSVT